MGRTGGGGARMGGSFGGGHSHSRSSGGHRVGSSSGMRTGSGRTSSYSRSRPSTGPSYHTHYHSYGYRRPRVYVSGGYTYYTNPVRATFNLVVSILTMLVIMFCLIMMLNAANKPNNSIVRYKLDTHNAYNNNCIDDQLGWFSNVSRTESRLKAFWEETGVQPYIILKDDDGTLSTDAEKEQWCRDYYDENIAPSEDAFLYVYFYENGEEYTGIPSYMGYANGYQASSVMDSAAVEIFFNYIDRYWETDMSTDDVFVETFTNTGKVIMHVSTTGKDIVKWIIILVVALVIGIVLTRLAKIWFKDRREKAKEDERILNTKIERMADTSTKDLEDKYLN